MVDTITIDNELNDDWMKTLPGYKGEIELIEQAGQDLSKKPVVVTLKDINADNQSGVMVAFRIPSDAANMIAIDEDAIPGAEVIPQDDLHITLVYMGDISGFQDEGMKQKVRDVVEAFAKSHTPLKGAVNGIGQFANATDGKRPFYANFDSPALPDFRQELVEALESSGVVISKNHGFTPHITLAYIPEGYTSKLPDIPTISITFDTLYLSMGEEEIAYELGKLVVVTLKGK